MLSRWSRRSAPRTPPPNPRPAARAPDHGRALHWTGVGLGIALVATLAAAHPMRAAIHARAGVRTVAIASVAEARAELAESPPPPTTCREPPLALRTVELAPTELARLLRQDPARLGSASIGAPNHGALWGGVPLVPNEGIDVAGEHHFGTDVTVRSIERAVREVRSCFPGTPKLSVGDISRERGGWLRPHHSHQSGLDADVGYYYLTGPGWFEPATAANLDRPRTWALVRALLDGGTVESMFMDHSVQQLLREYAERIDEDRPRLAEIFESDKHRHDIVIQHARGHTTHFHVRFRDPASGALGQRIGPALRIRPGAGYDGGAAELP